MKHSASVCVNLWLDVPVAGETLQEALGKANDLAFKDLVKTTPRVAGVNDFNVTVVGVSANDLPGF